MHLLLLSIHGSVIGVVHGTTIGLGAIAVDGPSFRRHVVSSVEDDLTAVALNDLLLGLLLLMLLLLLVHLTVWLHGEPVHEGDLLGLRLLWLLLKHSDLVHGGLRGRLGLF